MSDNLLIMSFLDPFSVEEEEPSRPANKTVVATVDEGVPWRLCYSEEGVECVSSCLMKTGSVVIYYLWSELALKRAWNV